MTCVCSGAGILLTSLVSCAINQTKNTWAERVRVRDTDKKLRLSIIWRRLHPGCDPSPRDLEASLDKKHPTNVDEIKSAFAKGTEVSRLVSTYLYRSWFR